MSGPHTEGGDGGGGVGAASPAERIAAVYAHRRPHLPSAEATFQGMLDDGVIVAGPTVLAGIEEAK